MILEVLKYILIVLGIIVVGAFIIYALASLMLAIVDPHAKDGQNAQNQQPVQNQQIVYEQPKLLNAVVEEPVKEEKVEQEDVKDVDLEKARQEELALAQGTDFNSLSEEEDSFIKEKQKDIEERINSKNEKEESSDEINLDDIFVEPEEENATQEEVVEEKAENQEDDGEDDEDIEALINKILAESDAENDEQNSDIAEEEKEATEEDENATEEVVEENSNEDQETEEQDIVEEEQAKNEDQHERIKALEEELARQKEEYETKLKEAEDAKTQETNEKIEELQRELAEKDKQLQENENKPAGLLSLEEYEERLKVLNDRLAVNEKEFRAVKKEYLPLAKIKKSYEKDKVKLRRKEALVAKQKVVLYGVNNYVDIDEEKAKKLSEDLDLLDGLRLSVQHCEEVLKQNEERYPILENSYNILLSTNENLKADIAECNAKIAELKANQE